MIHDQDADFLSKKKKLPPPGGAIGIIFRLFSVFIQPQAVEPDIRLKENDKIGIFTYGGSHARTHSRKHHTL